jgi:D-alanine-D-alanine ligase
LEPKFSANAVGAGLVYGLDTDVLAADIDDAASSEVRRVALEAFRVLDCAGLARVDVFLTPQGKVLVNEVNTLPDFTSISTYPKLWQASGRGYTALITRLIELAQEQYVGDWGLKTSVV